MLRDRLPEFILDHYECYEWKHASAILTQDFPAEWQDLLDVLTAFRFAYRRYLVVSFDARLVTVACG